MTVGFSYDGSVANTINFVNQLALLAVVSPTDPNFQSLLPAAITYAENRIYRDLDFLSTITVNYSYTTTPGTRSVVIPVSDFITIQNINIITGSNIPDIGTRNPLLPSTKEFLDNVYPAYVNATVPQYFAMLNQSTIYLGPWPDQSYVVEVVGTYRPNSMSASNVSTFISLYLPDLMIMAAMIYVSGYQRNFSSTGNDPQMPINYETQYQTLMKSAVVEEARKKFEAGGWTSKSPAVAATPSRG